MTQAPTSVPGSHRAAASSLEVTERRLTGVAVGGLTAIALAMALVAIRGEIANANVALLLVVPVAGAAAYGGRLAGATTALTAAMSFDFFHTRPYLSLKITAYNDIETALLLLLLGLAAAQLARRSVAAHEQRTGHLRGLARVNRISELVLHGGATNDLTEQIAAEMTDELGLLDCWYETAPFLAELPQVQANGLIDRHNFRLRRGGFELPHEGVAVPVTGRSGPVGRFILLPTPGHGVTVQQRLIAVALASQLAHQPR